MRIFLADAQAEPISIIQKSYPYDFTDGVELVYLDKGNKKLEKWGYPLFEFFF